MSKESKVFLQEAHLLIGETVDQAIHVITGTDFTLKDRLGGVLEEKDIDVLRNIELTDEEIEAIRSLLKAVGQLSVTGVLGVIDGVVMSSKVHLPDLLLINRSTGASISDDSFLNEEFYLVSEED